MVISHAHFHRAINGGSYIEILKALCTKKNIPHVSQLEENLNSNAIKQKLSKQCQELQRNIANETESKISSSKDEVSNLKTESETEESPKEED